ncbi:MAG: FAD-binding protein, partial [Moraxellaceae bacterium]
MTMSNTFYSAILTLPGIEVLTREGAANAYGADTGASDRLPKGAIIVKEADAIEAILALANTYKVPLWPISGGRNFGYGTALPVDARSYILDLSNLKRINIDVG